MSFMLDAYAGNLYEAKNDVFDALSTNEIIDVVRLEDADILNEYLKRELAFANNLEYRAKEYKREITKMIGMIEEEEG